MILLWHGSHPQVHKIPAAHPHIDPQPPTHPFASQRKKIVDARLEQLKHRLRNPLSALAKGVQPDGSLEQRQQLLAVAVASSNTAGPLHSPPAAPSHPRYHHSSGWGKPSQPHSRPFPSQEDPTHPLQHLLPAPAAAAAADDDFEEGAYSALGAMPEEERELALAEMEHDFDFEAGLLEESEDEDERGG